MAMHNAKTLLNGVVSETIVPNGFDLDIDQRSFPNEVKDFAEGRDTLTGEFRVEPGSCVEGFQILQTVVTDPPPAVRRPSQCRIMEDDDMAIVCEVNVEFNGVGAFMESPGKGGKRVFGSVSRRAAVSDDKRGERHPCIGAMLFQEHTDASTRTSSECGLMKKTETRNLRDSARAPGRLS